MGMEGVHLFIGMSNIRELIYVNAGMYSKTILDKGTLFRLPQEFFSQPILNTDLKNNCLEPTLSKNELSKSSNPFK
jgi:hypothetical protein